MAKFESPKFTVGSNDKRAQGQYEKNWDAVFGKSTDVHIPSVWGDVERAYAKLASSRFSSNPADAVVAINALALELERYLEESQQLVIEADRNAREAGAYED